MFLSFFIARLLFHLPLIYHHKRFASDLKKNFYKILFFFLCVLEILNSLPSTLVLFWLLLENIVVLKKKLEISSLMKTIGIFLLTFVVLITFFCFTFSFFIKKKIVFYYSNFSKFFWYYLIFTIKIIQISPHF